MGLISRTFAPILNVQSFAPIAIPSWISGRSALDSGKFAAFAKEGYQANELVYAAIEELATSAAEPTMRAEIGGKWVTEHPILNLLNRPNPFMDRFSFWAHVIMFLSLAGNAYALIVRSASGRPVELWLMRPDRVSIVPDATSYIARYEYLNGTAEPVKLPVGDVIHWKHRNPLDDFYGQSPLLAGSGRIDLDNYLRKFVLTFFTRAGVPSGMLNVEGAIDEATREELKLRYGHDFAGPDNWHGLMIIAGKKASFAPMTRELGNGGLVVPELDEINEARILMLLGVPPELIGARVGMQNSSYAQKRSARESFWDETLAPLYQEMAGPLNLRLVPNFPGVTRVGFDLTDVRALQEDEDKIHARVGNDVLKSLIGIKEGRAKLGLGDIEPGDTFLVPSNMVPVRSEEVRAGTVDLGDVRSETPNNDQPAAIGQ